MLQVYCLFSVCFAKFLLVHQIKEPKQIYAGEEFSLVLECSGRRQKSFQVGL